jgi:hypothetical protein
MLAAVNAGVVATWRGGIDLRTDRRQRLGIPFKGGL